jgi:hypothetical protein
LSSCGALSSFDVSLFGGSWLWAASVQKRAASFKRGRIGIGFGSCLQCLESGPATIVGPKSDQDYRALGQDASQPPHEIADMGGVPASAEIREANELRLGGFKRNDVSRRNGVARGGRGP